jgi:hypothetical protein
MILAAIDWAEQRQRVILMDEQKTVLERTSVKHDQPGLSHLDWLLRHGREPTTKWALLAMPTHPLEQGPRRWHALAGSLNCDRTCAGCGTGIPRPASK